MIKFTALFILLLSMLTLLPVHFTKGHVFNVDYVEPVNIDNIIDLGNGDIGIKRSGLYWDNVWYIIFFVIVPFVSIGLPFYAKLDKGWSRLLKYACFGYGGWYTAGLIIELINLFRPQLVYNSTDDIVLFVQFLIMFIVGMIFTTTHTLWIKSKQQKS